MVFLCNTRKENNCEIITTIIDKKLKKKTVLYSNNKSVPKYLNDDISDKILKEIEKICDYDTNIVTVYIYEDIKIEETLKILNDICDKKKYNYYKPN